MLNQGPVLYDQGSCDAGRGGGGGGGSASDSGPPPTTTTSTSSGGRVFSARGIGRGGGGVLGQVGQGGGQQCPTSPSLAVSSAGGGRRCSESVGRTQVSGIPGATPTCHRYPNRHRTQTRVADATAVAVQVPIQFSRLRSVFGKLLCRYGLFFIEVSRFCKCLKDSVFHHSLFGKRI